MFLFGSWNGFEWARFVTKENVDYVTNRQGKYPLQASLACRHIMFRRPSLPQSSSSTVENGHPITSTFASGRDQTTKRSVSNTSTATVIKETQDFNTEELFTKHTIAEIRVIQNRLGYLICHKLTYS